MSPVNKVEFPVRKLRERKRKEEGNEERTTRRCQKTASPIRKRSEDVVIGRSNSQSPRKVGKRTNSKGLRTPIKNVNLTPSRSSPRKILQEICKGNETVKR